MKRWMHINKYGATSFSTEPVFGCDILLFSVIAKFCNKRWFNEIVQVKAENILQITKPVVSKSAHRLDSCIIFPYS